MQQHSKQLTLLLKVLTVQRQLSLLLQNLKKCVKHSDTFENGITTVDAKGYYSDSKKTMIYYVVNRFQVGKMKTIVHNIDPKAYISLNDVADIFPANKNDNGSNNSVDETPTNTETPTLEEEIKTDLSEKLG